MASLIIRELDDRVKARLRVRAAQNGRSMEAEARAILAVAVAGGRPARGLGSHIRDQFADLDVELEQPSRHQLPRAANLAP